MSSPDDQFKINLNQNLWGLVVGLGGLGVAEYFHLQTLFWFTVVVAGVMVLSVVVTAVAYTINYWKHKMK
jgi:cytochrome c oxidase subunit IV